MIKNIHKIIKNNKKIHKFCIKFLKYYKKMNKNIKKIISAANGFIKTFND